MDVNTWSQISTIQKSQNISTIELDEISPTFIKHSMEEFAPSSNIFNWEIYFFKDFFHNLKISESSCYPNNYNNQIQLLGFKMKNNIFQCQWSSNGICLKYLPYHSITIGIIKQITWNSGGLKYRVTKVVLIGGLKEEKICGTEFCVHTKLKIVIMIKIVDQS